MPDESRPPRTPLTPLTPLTMLAVATMLAGGACVQPARQPAPASATPVAEPTVMPAAAPPAVATDTRAGLRAAIDSMVGAPEFANAHWGILIVDAERGDTLYSRNAGKLFMPASNQKIVTGAVALAVLGPDYRWITRYATNGSVRGATLEGDLVVIGRGDPTVSDHMLGDAMRPLRAVADSLFARGIRRVTGGVVRGGDAFPDAPLGYGWAWDDLDEAYAAGVDELTWNEGFTRVIVYGGGRAPRTLPAASYPRVRVARAEAGMKASRTLVARRDVATGDVLIEGPMPAAADSAVLEVALARPGTAYLAAMTQALTERGIAVGRSGAPSEAAVDTARLTTLVTMQSPPLRAVMPVLQKPSQNQMTELLYKTLGLERTGVGSADSARVVVERQLRAWGIEGSAAVVRDGSGLSRHDYVTPTAIVRVLAAMKRDTTFAVFHDALPIAGVDGTIANRMRGTPAQGNVHAKTGYIDRARSLSGYVTTADGRVLVFSMLANNWTTSVRTVERVQDAIAVRLATLGAAPAAVSPATVAAPAGR